MSAFPYTERPRVLIEHPDAEAGLELAAALRSAGFAVAICRGPDADGSAACPLHEFGDCRAVDNVDAVLASLDYERDGGRRVLEGLRTRYPGKPIVVAATLQGTFDLGHTLDACTVVPVEASPETVAAVVSRELRAARSG